MKILVLTNLYPPHFVGGYELICQTVVELLHERGHSIAILTSDHGTKVSASDGEAANSRGREPGAGRWSAGRDRLSELVSAPLVPGEEPIQIERTLRIHGLYGHPWVGIRQLRVLEEHNNAVLRAALQRHRPDFVYVWNMGGLSKSMLFSLQQSGLPTVFYVSDHWIARALPGDVWLRWWTQQPGGWGSRLARAWWTWSGVRGQWNAAAPIQPVSELRFPRIYFCSRALRDLTVRAGFDVAHGAIIYCPVHGRYLQDEPRFATGPVRRLLYAGRLAEDKGVMTALRALSVLPANRGFQLNLCGTGDSDYVAKLGRFARERGLAVQFSKASLDQMPSVYRSHDALLFTSEWAEPFALTPLEAMASGLPVIGTTTGGSAELFRHGENGLTYSAGCAEELATRILQLSDDARLRDHCARQAAAEVRDRFAAPVIVDQIEEYLRESLHHWPDLALI